MHRTSLEVARLAGIITVVSSFHRGASVIDISSLIVRLKYPVEFQTSRTPYNLVCICWKIPEVGVRSILAGGQVCSSLSRERPPQKSIDLFLAYCERPRQTYSLTVSRSGLDRGMISRARKLICIPYDDAWRLSILSLKSLDNQRPG